MASYENHFPSTWRRIIAHLNDQFYIVLLQSPVWIAVLMDYHNSEKIRISWPHLIYVIFVSLAYEILSLYFYSATLGKWQLGLRVLSRNGESELGMDQAILRVLVSRLSFYLGWSIFALAFFRHSRTHLADWVAGTQVVSTKPRESRPKIRLVIGAVLVFLTGTESIKSSIVKMNSLVWHRPFIYFQSDDFLKWFEGVEVIIKDADEEDDD